jgi:gamma-glutamylcyclotransferase (GGCT)/AIG2-like uncharacterized protein YtfP
LIINQLKKMIYQPQWYFAYGSNMNPQRMNARGMAYSQALAGQLAGFGLCFDKRASGKSGVGYATIRYQPGAKVEGVLYRLQRPQDIALMDPFEGNPYRYSREVFTADTQSGAINCWVYVANQALLAAGLLPEKLYLDHLLKGRPWLSERYFETLSRHPFIDNSDAAVATALNGLTHNV